MILDFELGFLRGAARLVDGQLGELYREAEGCDDPDGFGLLDEMEYITGFGFVACQTYMTAIIGRLRLSKKAALDAGPGHACGVTVAALVNACANYWKHSDEWREEALHAKATATLATIQRLGVNTTGSYLVSCALTKLLGTTPRFADLLDLLIAWRDDINPDAAASRSLS